MNNGLLAVIGLCMVCALALAVEEPAAAGTLLRGGDVSMLSRFEELGAVYRDRGKPEDAIRIMMDHGSNCFRLRLFVDPAMKGAVIQDLPYTAALARRVKHMGAALLLDIHYSDTWADPAHQSKPRAWEHLGPAELEQKVESYTADAMKTLKEAGCVPDIVQVGNEVTSGFLWPEGNIGARDDRWTRFATLLEAAIRGVRRALDPADSVQVMIHIDAGGNAATTGWFFRNIEDHEVEYDLIGLSYYPWWHGGIADLRDNLRKTAEEFRKGIVVVETAYPWRQDTGDRSMAWPQTPQGQRQFLEDVVWAVRSTPHGLGKGILWWYPESVSVRGLEVWKGGNAALFDAEGNALPAMDAFRAE